MIVCAVGTIGSSILCHSIPYTSESLPLKVGSFALFSSIMGATLAPVALMAGIPEGREGGRERERERW